MKYLASRPTLKLVYILLILVMAIVLGKLFFNEQYTLDYVFYLLTFMIGVITLYDFSQAKTPVSFLLKRNITNNFSFKCWHDASLIITNKNNKHCIGIIGY
jgi:hypothetical protein